MKFTISRLFIVSISTFILFSCKKNSKTSNKEGALALNNITEIQTQNIQNKGVYPTTKEKGMVWIPGGTFSMGTDAKCESMCQIGGLTADCKVHRVCVDGFWMDEHELTNAEFDAFVKATGYKIAVPRNNLALSIKNYGKGAIQWIEKK